jgi:competence ComEA-like helix-hairpin-helix protein
MKTLRRVIDRITLTRAEATALIVIASLYLVGFTWRYIQESTVPFDEDVYAELDSLIASGGLVVPDTLPKPKKKDSLGADSVEVEVDGRLDINSASMTDLIALPGIGPALAARIIDYRASRGDFAEAEDLIQVKGIGPAKMKRIRGLITAR